MSDFLLGNIGIFIVLWYGGYLTTSGSGEGLSSGDLSSFILYATSLADYLSGITYGLSSIVSSMSAMQRIFEIMDYEPFLDECKGEVL